MTKSIFRRCVCPVPRLLEEEGLSEDTIVFYSADNGYYMGYCGFAGKWSHHEQSQRVPLIIYDPRHPEKRRGRLLDTMALNLDLPSTFLDWAGEAIPASYQGASLNPVVEGETTLGGWRADFYCELFNPRYAISWEGVRGKRFKYARYTDREPKYEFLYDLENDPDELVIIADNPELESILKRLRKRARDLAEAYANKLPSHGIGARSAFALIL